MYCNICAILYMVVERQAGRSGARPGGLYSSPPGLTECLWRIDTVASFSTQCNNVTLVIFCSFWQDRLAISFFLDVADFKGVRTN
jgi:hypothetical protein